MALDPPPLPCRVDLIARDPDRNIQRRYSIEASPDLFGAVIVTTAWGRIGAGGQRKVVSFEEPAEAQRHVRATLRRRATSPTRNGVAYRRADGIEADGELWGMCSPTADA